MAFDTNTIITKVLEALVKFFSKDDNLSIHVEIPIAVPAETVTTPTVQEPKAPTYLQVEWDKENSQITPHFTVKEALTLHSWGRLATVADGVTEEVKVNIYRLCQKLEEVRDILGCGMNVHCIFRSIEYNTEVLHSLPHDVHALGMAIDFDCAPNLTIEQIKNKLEPELERLGLRMEKGTLTWVHLDIHVPGVSGRYFTA